MTSQYIAFWESALISSLYRSSVRAINRWPENIKRMIIQAVVATCLSPQTRSRFCFTELRKISEGKKRIRKCLSHHDCFKWYYIHVALLSVGHLLTLCSRQNGTHTLSQKTSGAWIHVCLPKSAYLNKNGTPKHLTPTLQYYTWKQGMSIIKTFPSFEKCCCRG